MRNLTLVIPIHNEQENVVHLAREISNAFQWAEFDWEVIWVDDCSDDMTVSLLQAHSAQNPNFKILCLPERCGKSEAFMKGIQMAEYDLIGTLDGDGQNSPFDILTLKRLVERDDLYLAQGVRVDRQDTNFRLFSSAIANAFRKYVLGDEFNDVGCAVRVFRKDIIESLPSFNGWHLFLPVITSFLYPDKVIEHPVSHRKRTAGSSKHGIFNDGFESLVNLFEMLKLKQRVGQVSRR